MLAGIHDVGSGILDNEVPGAGGPVPPVRGGVDRGAAVVTLADFPSTAPIQDSVLVPPYPLNNYPRAMALEIETHEKYPGQAVLCSNGNGTERPASLWWVRRELR